MEKELDEAKKKGMNGLKIKEAFEIVQETDVSKGANIMGGQFILRI